MMEHDVETRDLRQGRIKLREGRDGGEVMGLMERRQRNEPAQLGDHERRYERARYRVIRHAPPDVRLRSAVGPESPFQPAQKSCERILIGGPFDKVVLDKRHAGRATCGLAPAVRRACFFRLDYYLREGLMRPR